MRTTWNAFLVAGGCAWGGMMGMGTGAAQAQVMKEGTPASAATPGAPSGIPTVSSTLPVAFRPVGNAAEPAATRASLPAPAEGPSTAPEKKSYWTGPPRPKKTSAVKRFFNRFGINQDGSEGKTHAIYVDPSTGRTDLPLSKPWLTPAR